MGEINLNNVKKQPEKKIRAGPIAIAIWRNNTNDGMRSFYSITFEKRFKDKDKEEWRSTNQLGKNDIPKAMIALQEAYKYLVLHKSPQEIIEEALDDNIELPKENYFEDEFEKERPPHGMYFFWEIDGKRVYSPGAIIKMVQDDVMNGSFEMMSSISPESVQNHYKKLYETQRQTALNGFKQLKEHYNKMKYPKDVMDYIDDVSKLFKKD